MESYFLGFDPVTLEERFDVAAAQRRLDELADRRGLAELAEKIGLLRVTDRLDEAGDVANEAARQARFTGDREDLLRVKVARAQVLRAQGKHEQALQELTAAVGEAETAGLWDLIADARRQRALTRFDAGDFVGAHDDFNEALVILVREHATPREIDTAMIAVGVLLDRVAAVG